MKRLNDLQNGAIAAAVLTLSMVIGFGYLLQFRVSPREQAQAETLGRIALWPDRPRLLGSLMIERYGPPDETSGEALTWNYRDAWKRIVVHQRDRDPLEQSVSYGVPPEKLRAVRAIGHSIAVDRRSGEVSARGEREGLNMLAINLAVDVAQGRMTSRQAREFYAKTANLAASGKTSPYMERLLFTPKTQILLEGEFRGLRFDGGF
jgi:hypothetical protein